MLLGFVFGVNVPHVSLIDSFPVQKSFNFQNILGCGPRLEVLVCRSLCVWSGLVVLFALKSYSYLALPPS